MASSRQADSEHFAGGWKPPLRVLKCALIQVARMCGVAPCFSDRCDDRPYTYTKRGLTADLAFPDSSQLVLLAGRQTLAAPVWKHHNHKLGQAMVTRQNVDGVVAVIPQGDRLLVIRRSRHVVAPRQFCFPGGHLVSGESEQEGLVRELDEELQEIGRASCRERV